MFENLKKKNIYNILFNDCDYSYYTFFKHTQEKNKIHLTKNVRFIITKSYYYYY